MYCYGVTLCQHGICCGPDCPSVCHKSVLSENIISQMLHNSPGSLVSDAKHRDDIPRGHC